MKQRYREYLVQLRTELSDEVFGNSELSDIIQTFSEMFKFAKKEIQIVMNSHTCFVLNEGVCLSSLEDFLKRTVSTPSGKPLNIMILTDDEHVDLSYKLRYPLYHLLMKYKENVALWVAKKDCFVDEDKNPIVFMVVDKTAYRFEYDCVKHTSLNSFNQPKESRHLHNVFKNAANTRAHEVIIK